MKPLYTATVTATGGRTGHVRSSDGIIDMPVSMPEGLGGDGKSSNPEQLFAAGYASCFQSALMVVAGMQQIPLAAKSTVTAHVTLNKNEHHSYGLSVKLDVDLHDVEKDLARQLVEKAHEICPYSIGTRGNIEVELNIV